MEQPRKTAQPLSEAKETKSGEQKRKVPTAQELITHYERQGLETKEASIKVIEDLQKALFRVVTSSSSSRRNGKGENLTAETRRKLDVINTRLVNLDMKVDSKPGYGETLAIGVASGAALRGIGTLFPHLVRALGNIWNAVRSATNPNTATASDSSPSTSAAPSIVASPIFNFGSTSAAPLNFGSTALTTSIVEPTDSKAKTENETTKTENETTLGNQIISPFGGTSSAIGSTGSGIFGNSVSATSAANSLSQSSCFVTGSEPLVGPQASPAGTGVASVTQSTPIQFGSSAASPIFGTSGISSFSTSTSTSTSSTFGSSTSSSFVLGSSTSSSSMFGSSTPSVFGLGTSFGQSSQASSSETNSVSSRGATSSLFSSNWQPVKSPVFSSTFNTVSPSTGFSFSASSISAPAAAATSSAPILFGSSTGALLGSIFPFSSLSATASSSQVQPVFGSSVPVFTGASGNGDQMSMEDTMAEDPVQTTSTPTVPVFGQPPISTPSSGFVFGSAASSGGLPFQFGGQQNQSGPQFQPSGSLEFSAGGSFSLGSSGVDKASGKIVKVKHKTRRR